MTREPGYMRRDRAVAEVAGDRHAQAFAKLYPELAKWLAASEGPFSTSIKRQIRSGYLLSPSQLAALERAAAPAPVVDVSHIEAAFAKAKERGVKHPKLRLDTFKFAPSGPSSLHQGAVFVREGEAYLGKVLHGRFQTTKACDDATRDRVIAAIADPEAAAVAYGQRTGACAVCGRPLIVTSSVDLGIGPVCREKFFA